MADLIKVRGSVGRIDFDKVRVLKPQHRHIRNAVLASQKSVFQLLDDPFGGVPFVLQALLHPGWVEEESGELTLDKCSDLIDEFLNKGGTTKELQKALVTMLADYLHIELPKKVEAELNAEEDVPNAPRPELRANA